MKNTVKYLLILLVAAGCATKKDTSNNIENQIEAKANACKDTSKCNININEFTKFKWESMYVFNYPETREIIEGAIGGKFPGYEEGMRPLIFINKGEIVYFENNPDGMVATSVGQVVFNYRPGIKFFAFTPDKATFAVRIAKSKGKTFYEMFQQ